MNTRFYFLLTFLVIENEPELESEKEYCDEEPESLSTFFLFLTSFFFFLLFLDKDPSPSLFCFTLNIGSLSGGRVT